MIRGIQSGAAVVWKRDEIITKLFFLLVRWCQGNGRAGVISWLLQKHWNGASFASQDDPKNTEVSVVQGSVDLVLDGCLHNVADEAANE